jgi:hypothetical protein
MVAGRLDPACHLRSLPQLSQLRDVKNGRLQVEVYPCCEMRLGPGFWGSAMQNQYLLLSLFYPIVIYSSGLCDNININHAQGWTVSVTVVGCDAISLTQQPLTPLLLLSVNSTDVGSPRPAHER